MDEVTVVVTACNRPDLLKTTIDSFLGHNTHPISEWIVVDDGGVPEANAGLMRDHPEFVWLTRSERLGQIRSIDEAYSRVRTEYVFHLEDDWETYRDGAVRESIRILKEHPNASAVMCREHTPRVYHMSDDPPFLKCWGGLGHYSFNPGLRRMSHYKDFFGSSFSAFGGSATALQVERKINDFYREKGCRMALTPDPRGYVRHIGEGRHVAEPVRVGLCMIVKDEAHVIGECLSATLPLVDTYCIVDTGSSDGTVEVIKKFYGERGVPGEVHERPWVDFGHNRSEALALCDGKMDYILVMDADDLIVWEGDGRGALRDALRSGPSSVSVPILSGNTSYSRKQVFRANDGWRYVGVLHEYPSNGKDGACAEAPRGMRIISRRLGGRNLGPGKMKRDIEVLLSALEREPDNERHMFYLAQSYRDDGQVDKAVEWYKRRYEAGGWVEERCVAAHNVARLTGSKEWAWRAHECNPARSESLVSYMSHCRARNMFSKELLAMAIYASSIPKPTDQRLFLENDAYDWRVWDELSIIAHYCGAREVARLAYDRLVSEGKFPPEQAERIRGNGRFFSGRP